jgi:hypothetical protein
VLTFQIDMKNWLRVPTLVLSAMLHLAPLMRVAVAESAVAVSPLMAVIRWMTGAAAVAGAFHGVSGATGLTITQGTTKVTSISATNSVQAAGFRMSIVSSVHGTAASYTFSGLPAGMTGSLQGVVTGIPTVSGTFSARVTGWQNAGGKGDNYTTTFSIKVVDQVPTIVTPPTSVSVSVGDPVTFTATVTGTGLTYRWLKDDIELAAPAGTAASYVIASAKLTDAGKYKLRITNTGGTAVSTEAVLTVKQAGPTVTVPPAGANLHEGEAFTLSVQATGAGAISYQWLKSGSQIPGGTTSSLTLNGVKLSDAGSYTVVVSSGGVNVSPAAAVLKVSAAPVATLGAVATDGSSSVTFDSISGRSYIVEERPAVDAGDWTAVKTVTAGGVTTTVAAPSSAGSTRFLRARVVPISQ